MWHGVTGWLVHLVISTFEDETTTPTRNAGNQLSEGALHPSKPKILRIEEYLTGFWLCSVNKAWEG